MNIEAIFYIIDCLDVNRVNFYHKGITMEELNQHKSKESVKVNIRTFKSSAEIENLYRFIDALRLRKEAKLIFEKFFSMVSHSKRSKSKAQRAARKKALRAKQLSRKSKKIH